MGAKVPTLKEQKRKVAIAARRGARIAAEIDKLSVKIVTAVAAKVDRNGVLEAYEGIEAAREVRALITKFFATNNRFK